MRDTAGSKRGLRAFCACVICAVACAPAARGQEPQPLPQESRNLFGMTGLVDMPSARVQPDGELGFTSAYFGGFLRNTLSFQFLPRVEGAFRYSIIDEFFATDGGALYDRSFDVKFLLSDETGNIPAIAFGLQDFLGTGIYSGEYFVGTKTLTPGLSLTGGFGWGRFGTLNGVANPFGRIRDEFKTRETTGGDTGEVRFGQFFRGEDVGFFGGLEWRPSFVDGLTLKAEYSSDDYEREGRFNDYDHKLPFNFGAEYRLNRTFSLGGYYMYGSDVGLRASIAFNPARPAVPQQLGPAPIPLEPRPPAMAGPPPDLGPVVERIGSDPASGSDAAYQVVLLDAATEGARWAEARTAAAECPTDAALDIDAAYGVIDGATFRDPAGEPVCTVILRPEGRRYVERRRALMGGHPTGWYDDPALRAALAPAVAEKLAADDIGFVGLDLSPTRARLEIENRTYNAAPQAIGRAAVALANTLPPSVEDLEITLAERGLPTVTILLRRARLEAAAELPDQDRISWLDAEVRSAEPIPGSPLPQFDASYPRFGWFIAPGLPISLFDPDQPLRADLQLRAGASMRLARGLSVSGSARKSLLGGFDDIPRASDSELPRVRSNFRFYFDEGDPGIDRLTGDYLFKLSPETYGRMSLGLLERMFGGVSGEVLWKPATRNWGLGAELNYVQQRDYDLRFGFRDYDVVTGHASAYVDTGWNGMEVQVDAGRYLAGDWGGTFTLSRRFANGWEVGGFFTLTDVPFDVYGEGSFDKGIFLTIPFSWGLPYETRERFTTTIRPLTRDGGARLSVGNRLYPIVQEADAGDLRADWGHFWQ